MIGDVVVRAQFFQVSFSRLRKGKLKSLELNIYGVNKQEIYSVPHLHYTGLMYVTIVGVNLCDVALGVVVGVARTTCELGVFTQSTSLRYPVSLIAVARLAYGDLATSRIQNVDLMHISTQQ
jgi:hypothetical protein